MKKNEVLFLNDFGKRMAITRKQKGFTQEKLGFAVGVSPTYIGFIEQGRRNPTILNIYKISKVLGVNLKSVFSVFDK
jgi:transcriptional regulator with XRE-family HTH domain